MVKSIEGYITDDGKFFESQRDAMNYEALAVIERIGSREIGILTLTDPDEFEDAAALIKALVTIHDMPGLTNYILDNWVSAKMPKEPA